MQRTVLTIVQRSFTLVARNSRGMKIYTRTGDKGSSALYTGERRAKTDAVFNALGTIDELSSNIGLAISHLDERQPTLQNSKIDLHQLRAQLIRVQCRLQDLGSCVATPIPNVKPEAAESMDIGERKKRHARVAFTEFAVVEELEPWIDEMTSCIPPLFRFVLPSGGVVAAQLHVARTVCRRAERLIVAVNEERVSEGQTVAVEPSATAFVNRLSDYLFTAARFASTAFKVTEIPYQKLEK